MRQPVSMWIIDVATGLAAIVCFVLALMLYPFAWVINRVCTHLARK